MTTKNKLFIFLFLCSICSSAFSQHKYETKNLIDGVLQDRGEGKFSLHRPTYILFGKDDAKLQFSAKYRLLKKSSLYFEYSQKMFWDIYEKSQPFREINYHPGLFYRFNIKDKIIRAIDMGYLHSSNGEDRSESRSIDQIYLKTFFEIEIFSKDLLSTLEVYETFNEDDKNHNIKNYIGYYKLTLLLQNPFGLEELDLALSGYAGKEIVNFDDGAYELYLRLESPFDSFNPDMLLQYFNGHAENLLEYDKKQESIRLGLLFYI